jgi:hypothetical protein
MGHFRLTWPSWLRGEISGLSPGPLPRVVTRQASPVVCGGLRDFRAPALQEAALTIIKRRLPRVVTTRPSYSRRRRRVGFMLLWCDVWSGYAYRITTLVLFLP